MKVHRGNSAPWEMVPARQMTRVKMAELKAKKSNDHVSTSLICETVCDIVTPLILTIEPVLQLSSARQLGALDFGSGKKTI